MPLDFLEAFIFNFVTVFLTSRIIFCEEIWKPFRKIGTVKQSLSSLRADNIVCTQAIIKPIQKPVPKIARNRKLSATTTPTLYDPQPYKFECLYQNINERYLFLGNYYTSLADGRIVELYKNGSTKEIIRTGKNNDANYCDGELNTLEDEQPSSHSPPQRDD